MELRRLGTRYPAVPGALVFAAAGAAYLLLVAAVPDREDSDYFWWGYLLVIALGFAVGIARGPARGLAASSVLAVIPMSSWIFVEGGLRHDPNNGASFWILLEVLMVMLWIKTMIATGLGMLIHERMWTDLVERPMRTEIRRALLHRPTAIAAASVLVVASVEFIVASAMAPPNQEGNIGAGIALTSFVAGGFSLGLSAVAARARSFGGRTMAVGTAWLGLAWSVQGILLVAGGIAEELGR